MLVILVVVVDVFGIVFLSSLFLAVCFVVFVGIEAVVDAVVYVVVAVLPVVIIDMDAVFGVDVLVPRESTCCSCGLICNMADATPRMSVPQKHMRRAPKLEASRSIVPH